MADRKWGAITSGATFESLARRSSSSRTAGIALRTPRQGRPKRNSSSSLTVRVEWARPVYSLRPGDEIASEGAWQVLWANVESSQRFARHPAWLTLAVQHLEDRGDLKQIPTLADEYLTEIE
jgi:hypothetical protein